MHELLYSRNKNSIPFMVILQNHLYELFSFFFRALSTNLQADGILVFNLIRIRLLYLFFILIN